MIPSSLNLAHNFALSREWLSMELKYHHQCEAQGNKITTPLAKSISSMVQETKVPSMNTPHVSSLQAGPNPVYSVVLSRDGNLEDCMTGITPATCELRMNGFTLTTILEEMKKNGADLASCKLYSEFEPQWTLCRDRIMQGSEEVSTVQPFARQHVATLGERESLKRVQVHQGEWTVGNAFQPSSYHIRRQTATLNGKLLTEQIHLEHRQGSRTTKYHSSISLSASHLGEDHPHHQILHNLNPILQDHMENLKCMQLQVVLGLDQDALSCSCAKPHQDPVQNATFALAGIRANCKHLSTSLFIPNLHDFNTELKTVDRAHVLVDRPGFSLVVLSGESQDFLVLSTLGVAC